MTLIRFDEANAFLAGLVPGNTPSVILLTGESFLVRRIQRQLVDQLVPEADRAFSYAVYSGDTDIRVAIEQVNTYGFSTGPKVVAVTELPFTSDKKQTARRLDRIRKNVEASKPAAAATGLVALLSALGLDPADYTEAPSKLWAAIEGTSGEAPAWLGDLLFHIRDHQLKAAAPEGLPDLLANAAAAGFPDGNVLVVTTDTLDKRRKAFKTLESACTVIDCSVPKGERKADREIQEKVMRMCAAELLDAQGKRLAPAGLSALMDLTGFDLDTFTGNLEKLIDYAGPRQEITAADVRQLLVRTRQDPIFELTSALADRNAGAAVFYARSLARAGMHPLQIQAALVNQVRRLLAMSLFIKNHWGEHAGTAMPYNAFTARVMPLITAFDARLDEWAREDEQALACQSLASEKKKAPQKKTASDRRIGGSGKSAYPIYQLFQKAGKFTPDELVRALNRLLETDQVIKSSAIDPLGLIEHAILTICSCESLPGGCLR
ncbi:MAG: hypothetical protein CSA22_06325 [Deltaproteobacteria bacterium]|nr:MAG: hypothetical protein CSA22_06325 [Deltaproteobacteria bacterium]